MKKHTMMATLIVVACALSVSVAMLAGCGGKVGGGTLSAEIIAETGAFKVTADNADAKAAIETEEAITLKEGDVLLVSPDLTRGKMQLTITSKSGEVVYDEEKSGRVLSTHEIAPGVYNVNVTCKEAGTTGSLLVVGTSAEDYEKQNGALDAALTQSAGSEAAEKVAEATGSAPDYAVDYGNSELYGATEIESAMQAVMDEFKTWKGCTMKRIAFTDDTTCADNVAYCNELRKDGDPEFDQAIVLKTDFRSPSEQDAEGTAWQPDTDYNDYTWTLGRANGGEWKLLTWGYA